MACTPEPPAVVESTEVFEGAWFEVSYPASFQARPSLESSSADGYDSAFFDAPDGEVSFYVHAPQWGGEATDIVLDPITEEVVDSATSTVGSITTTHTTIAARDGAWTRSYVTTYDDRGPSQWTIGWRYASEQARDRYAAAFDAFKESLKQFAN
jgi:hypothetical protein